MSNVTVKEESIDASKSVEDKEKEDIQELVKKEIVYLLRKSGDCSEKYATEIFDRLYQGHHLWISINKEDGDVSLKNLLNIINTKNFSLDKFSNTSKYKLFVSGCTDHFWDKEDWHDKILILPNIKGVDFNILCNTIDESLPLASNRFINGLTTSFSTFKHKNTNKKYLFFCTKNSYDLDMSYHQKELLYKSIDFYRKYYSNLDLNNLILKQVCDLRAKTPSPANLHHYPDSVLLSLINIFNKSQYNIFKSNSTIINYDNILQASNLRHRSVLFNLFRHNFLNFEFFDDLRKYLLKDKENIVVNYVKVISEIEKESQEINKSLSKKLFSK